MEDELKSFQRSFKFETDEELGRKRGIYRAFIVSDEEEQANIRHRAGDLEGNRRRYAALSEIIQHRQRPVHRRETLKEVVTWAGLVGPFLAGVAASPTLAAAWNAAISALASGHSP